MNRRWDVTTLCHKSGIFRLLLLARGTRTTLPSRGGTPHGVKASASNAITKLNGPSGRNIEHRHVAQLLALPYTPMTTINQVR